MQYSDQLGNSFYFSEVPKRIVSLVPSQTELLVDLGLKSKLVGVTKFCVHPKDLRSEVMIAGGTKQVNFEKIKTLAPDVIICNKEENTIEMVRQLGEIAPVWVSDVVSIESSLDLIERIGLLFSVEVNSRAIQKNIKNEMDAFIEFMAAYSTKKVAYLIWKDPYMAAGRNTFINQLLKLNKFENVLVDPASRYPEVEVDLLRKAELILLSSEPYPFKEAHVTALKNTLNKEVRLVDGEYFSWYGSRLQNAFSYFKTLHS